MILATRSLKPSRLPSFVVRGIYAPLSFGDTHGSTCLPTDDCLLTDHPEKCRHKLASMPRWLSSAKVETVRKLLAGASAFACQMPHSVPNAPFVCVCAQRIRPCCAPHVAIKPPSSCSDSCLCAGCASRLASRPTAPKRPLPSATSRTCSLDKHPSSNTRPATLVGIRSTSSWPSTRRAEAPQPFRFARFFKMPTASCTCAYACTQTQTNSNPFTPPFGHPPPLQDPCPWAPRATTHTMCTRAPRAHRGFAPCQPQTRECTLEAHAS